MNKYRIYIDEVGNNDLKSSEDFNHRFLSLSGVIFDSDYIKDVVSPSLEKMKAEYFSSHPDEPVIFHRKELINQKFPFQALKDEKVRKKFNEELLSFFESLNFVLITVLIDKLEHTRKYETWKYDPYHYCMEIIIERYFFFLRDKASEGDVMVESRGGKEDVRLKNSYHRILSSGTSYIKSELLKQNLTSSQLKIKPKSANVSGLQIADLVAYPSRQHLFETYGLYKKTKYTFNDDIIEILLKKYYRSNDKIEGYGIKLLP